MRDSFFEQDVSQQAISSLSTFTTGLPNTLILTGSASAIGLLLGMALAADWISH
ncbi:hypothetical protein ABFA25_03530 [Mycobacterium lepromatosis]|nr:hypothetical protein [Mycobacterium lepromatosis]